jgi:type 1 fimbria pilin
MKSIQVVFTTIAFLLVSSNAFAQAGNASVGGFVQDSSQSVIPGVSVTAENVQTGVVTSAVTNETGTYTILSLLPGTYRLTAELPGFRAQTYNDVQLGTGRAGALQLHAAGGRSHPGH